MPDHQLNDKPIIMTPWIPPKNDTWKSIIRPVTVFLLLQAEPSPVFEDKSLVIEGRGFAAVTLVAHIISVHIDSPNVFYILEDGTGRMYADKDLDSVTYGLGSFAEAEESDQCQALEHTYVEILGVPRKDKFHQTRLKICAIQLVQGYHHVVYHALSVIHSSMLTQQYIQPYDCRPSAQMEVSSCADDVLINQDDVNMEQHAIHTVTIPASHTILPDTFSPQKHQPYAALEPVERAIMKYMCHHKNHPVLIEELAQAIQASCGCTGAQFNVAVQVLLSEAYITSPLDDGCVVITPRH